MPASPEQIRAAMEGLTPEQQAQFVSELERRQTATPAPAKSDPVDIFRGQLGRMGSFGAAPTQEDIQAGREANIPMLTLGAMAAPAMIPTSLAGLKAAGLGVAGASAGGYAGSGIGRGLEMAGAPEGTSEVGGTIGGLVGGVAGPLGGPQVLARLLKLGGGKGGMLAEVGERAFGMGAAKAVAPEVAEAAAKKAAERAAVEAEKVALRKRALDVAERRLALAEKTAADRAARAAGKTGPRAVPKTAPKTSGATALKPDPDIIPDEAVSIAPEPEFIDPSAVKVLPFPPQKGQTTMPTNLGGKAKPGPAPTPPDKVEEALRASLKPDAKIAPAQVETALRDSVEELSAEGLQIPRIQIGAEKVGRQVGMLKEQVRQVAGPVLNEARGEASPIFPRKALESIVDKMRTIPPGPEREAYVRAATSDKAMWQVETIRRTLEKLGLLVPVGVAAGTMSE